MAANFDEAELQRVYQHVFLPPDPHQTSEESANLDRNLLASTRRALERFPEFPIAATTSALTAVKNLQAVSDSSESHLRQALNTLEDGDTLPVHVSSQNAGILITQKRNDLIFESFELSPTSSAVLATKGRLTRCFPSVAVAVDTQVHPKHELNAVIAKTLHTLSLEITPEMQPSSKKAGTNHAEYRDTTNPAIVTEMLFGFLRGLGNIVSVSSVTKQTRDEVFWDQAYAPWRRSPLWLLLKVTLHLTITRASDGSNDLYKRVMVFLMNQLLDAATSLRLPNDILYAMSAKIVRRVHKLHTSGASIDDRLIVNINGVLQKASVLIESRWKVAQHSDNRSLDLGILAKLDLERDTRIALPALDAHIISLKSRAHRPASREFQPTSSLLKTVPTQLPQLPTRNSWEYHYATSNLQAVESWVASHLDGWVSGSFSSCDIIHEYIKNYHELASDHYRNNPEGTSVMLLTIFELWVACDKLAVAQCPLLAEYPPQIPLESLQHLLLPFQHQMARLQTLKNYLEGRTCQARAGLLTFLFSTDSPNAFAARYFQGSQEHQRLRDQIVQEAKAAKLAKQAEYRLTRSEYDRLHRLYMQAACEFETVVIDPYCNPPQTHEEHKNDCQKCDHLKSLNSLEIRYHEWPLPANDAQSASVVFELKVPVWYAAWRDARAFFLCDVLKGDRSAKHPEATYDLHSDPHLSHKLLRARTTRVGLLSEVKPVVRSHYAVQKIPAVNVDSVCVENGLRYAYHDRVTGRDMRPLSFDQAVPKSCMYTLATRSLQRYLFRPSDSPDGEAPNSVIASQDACPDNMSVDEYRELATFPLRHHLQWVNVLQQLAMPTVDFRKGDTTLTFLQCINQAGPPNNHTLRESHAVLRDKSTALDVIANLEVALERIKQNWESSQALYLFVSIATRVLSLNDAIQDACLDLLAKMRSIAFGWLHTLREATHAATDDEYRLMFVSKSVEIAYICGLTYDVQAEHMSIILSSVDHCSILLQISVIAQDGGDVQRASLTQNRMLRMRFVRILHRSYELLALQPVALDNAVKNSWSSYTPGPRGWGIVSQVANDWVTTKTAAVGGLSTRVHYSILSGELLVNGMPLDQPPKDYRGLPLYSKLFGNSIVEVMPSLTPGFQFSTKRTFGGHAVLLGRQILGSQSDLELVVRASRADAVAETLPYRLLGDNFPEDFLKKYVHWYNLESGHVEFRPIQDPWEPHSPAMWILRRAQDSTWQLTKDFNIVAGLRSPTAKAVSKIFRPLAEPDQTYCIFQTQGASLKIDIPGLNLSFSFSKGSSLLRSKEYPSMTVDTNQALGTLIGFANKLMLVSSSGDRMLLLPDASISYSRQQAHTTVRLTSLRNAKKAHAFGVDSQLGRLVDQGDLGCKLYLAYLHALTSGCWPDPLTHMTGTEQALQTLDSCAVRSFSQLTQANVDTLALIAGLSPARCYYPVHKKVMQTVTWDGRLSFLSQHARLRLSVQAIFNQAREAQIYHPDVELAFPNLQELDSDLQQRDSIRSSKFRVAEFGAEDHSIEHDAIYDSRDREIESPRSERAALISGLLSRPNCDLHWDPPTIDHLWQKLVKCSTGYGPDAGLGDIHLAYDKSCLDGGYIAKVLARLPSLIRKLGQLQQQRSCYTIAIWLATMAFADDADMKIIQLIAMSFKCPALPMIQPPSVDSFWLIDGISRHGSIVRNRISQTTRYFEFCPEAHAPRMMYESNRQYSARCRGLWASARNSAIERALTALIAQFPASKPTPISTAGISQYIDTERMMRLVQELFLSWHNNNLLHDYMSTVLQLVAGLSIDKVQLPILASFAASPRVSVPGYVTTGDIFSGDAPHVADHHCLPQPAITGEGAQVHLHASADSVSPKLKSLVGHLIGAAGTSSYEMEYATDLGDSLSALRAKGSVLSSLTPPSIEELKRYRDTCKQHVHQAYEMLNWAIKNLGHYRFEQAARHWPRLSTSFLLQQLSHDRIARLPRSWRTSIVNYGVAITALQQAGRLLALAEAGQSIDLLNELRNSGHTNWDPHEYLESLLMEVESGIMIREVQEEIATEMRAPSSRSNAVMQLNMGEGKSTVITPMVAAALADGHQLVRVIVEKPQSKQMASMMIAKFGGLVNRRIYYMPFSRSLALSLAAAKIIDQTMRQCMSNGGILLVQPEHLLSFKLMAPECYMSGNELLGQRLMTTQDFFDRHSRDIVDESDENFSVRFELIYTMGMQQSIELSPDRWFFLQQIFDLVQDIAPQVFALLPNSVEISSNGAGGFSRLRLLKADAIDMLIHKIAAHIRDNGLEGFQISRQSESMRDAIFMYITSLELDDSLVHFVEHGEFWEAYKSSILLIRGILAGGVLSFAFSQKRWRVNYDLAVRLPPTKLAVPYHAKDSPSPRSEFSHPDVVIVLTSLCYYYDGLRDDDMFTALSHLMKSDQADAEYQVWIKSLPDLPTAFAQLQGINLKDQLQCKTLLFPHLRYGKAVVDYFLSHIVFPKEMKEFPHKLSASGWDIGKKKQLVTTGFSGTNDSRRLLPLDVHQLDLEKQKHTNALVLEYLLQPVNRIELMSPASSEDEQLTDAAQLISTAVRLEPSVQVILDVGAQILELDNLGVAKAWLKQSDAKVEAVVFVDDADEICVVDRKDRVDLLRISSFATRLDACLVFLDESHTRGIDLKLPGHYRALVTLGTNLSKDRLVQACMRMRKLGKGQSVTFCISPEIQTKIRENKPGSASTAITVEDVLFWSISETHTETRRSMPLWSVQGERFVCNDKGLEFYEEQWDDNPVNDWR